MSGALHCTSTTPAHAHNLIHHHIPLPSVRGAFFPSLLLAIVSPPSLVPAASPASPHLCIYLPLPYTGASTSICPSLCRFTPHPAPLCRRSKLRRRPASPYTVPILVLPATCTKTKSLRRYSYNCKQSNCTETPPPLPPRRNSAALSALVHLKTTSTQPSAMTSRYGRASSPRGRYSNPARSSTGTFDPYYDSTYYGRPSSPRTSGERLSGSSHYPQHTYAPSSSTSSRSPAYKYDTYTGRPRRSTLTEPEDRPIWPNIPPPALPTRPHVPHLHHDRPSSPLSRNWDSRGDTYITYPPSRREHKRIYSVDDNSHSAKLIAEKDIVEPRRRDLDDRGYSITSGGRSYHSHKPVRTSDVGDDGYSYTDPASMYRDTEPAWRRPRSGSVERGARPTSMIADRAPRSSNRELGPPPSTRGFDKINNSVNRSGSHHRGRSPSLERSRDVSKYDSYADPLPSRPASTLYHAPVVSQEPRRDPYRNDYARSDRDAENRRYAPPVEHVDTDVAKRGFGIASPSVAHASEAPYQPHWNTPEPPRTRPAEYGNQYYSSERAESRMPEPRVPREREGSSTYEERPRERDRDRDYNRREGGHAPAQSAIPPVVGAVAGAAATVGGALLKNRNKDRDTDRDYDRDRELEREREQRREWDERDRRDWAADDRRDEKRDRNIEDRRDRPSEDRRDRAPEDRRDRMPEERAPPPPAASYNSTQDGRKPRERRSDDDERERRTRKAPSSEGSGDERPRHYVEREAPKESEHRKDSAPALDPDEEYRRRIQLEAERSGRGRDAGDSDREKERQRRREERDKSRDQMDEYRSRAPPSNVAEAPRSRHDDRNSHVLDTNIVQEPDSMSLATQEQPSRSVQIVTPPKEPQPQPKGILRKPTEKFPEEPEPIREGVAPHKSQLKGKDIPVNARWTKIDRRLVNPEALEEAKERFEERLDFVIVLRVLTKQEIQKLADRTKEIRETREDDYDRRDRDRDYDRDHDRDHDRERRNRRHRDEDDRDRRRDYDDDDDIGRDRDRERDRERPRMLEDGR
ncbi:unnamed protein product [Periconia digitata]|uniref:DUF8035 domain-containing protein n=1 Tax=Periconia digitata TaxID=1303443 RepID=A0A9W4UUS5_9PLEO|nr:unnamed protein product [Periconia digitata]